MPLHLTATDLEVWRGGRPVFAGLSFRVTSGEALGVVGPNGSGKSTLLRLLAGLLPADTGGVRLEPPAEDDPERPLAERVHYLGHADGLKGGLTPLENLAFLGAIAGAIDTPPPEALRRFGLAHVADLPCGYLSAGQRRRVALCRLLVAARPVWLLDEPTTALDAGSAATLTAVMEEHLGRGGLILAATHAPLGLANLRQLRLGLQPSREGSIWLPESSIQPLI